MPDPTTPRQLAREAVERGDQVIIYDAKTTDRWLLREATRRALLGRAETPEEETDRRLAAGEADALADRLDAEARTARAAGDSARSPFYGDA